MIYYYYANKLEETKDEKTKTKTHNEKRAKIFLLICAFYVSGKRNLIQYTIANGLQTD